MHNMVQVFNVDNYTIRTTYKDGEIWWVAKDICAYFGDTNRNRTMQVLDDDEKGYTQIATRGGVQTVAVVNEAGLYSMLFAMQPQKGRGVTPKYIAERVEKLNVFIHWATHEVLPSIRKTGYYVLPQKLEEGLYNPEKIISLAMRGVPKECIKTQNADYCLIQD